MGSRVNARKGALAVGAGVAAMLVLASVAFACVPYKGRFEVRGTGQGGTKVSVVGKGMGMRYCEDEQPVPAELPGGGFTAAVSPKVGGECEAQLPDGVYQVSAITGFASPEAIPGCMFLSPYAVGVMTVTGGRGSGTYAIPDTSPRGYGAICVNSRTSFFADGNRAPVLVL